MIETSITAWIWMLAAMLASSGAGLALVRFVPWSNAARQAGIPRTFAFAIAPFLLGMLAVLALGVFRGASHAFHLGVVFAGLLLLCSTGTFSRPLPKLERPATPLPIGLWEWVVGGLLAVWVVLLIADTLFMPLMQNDALEYATVGRLLYELRDLFAYPALDPMAGRSGFYGPWTHPPLYPALIYITYVFQGHNDSPGLMRLISPWCALAATAVIYAMGRLASRVAGMLAAVIFLSTPLFFLGVGSALIDALPILGMALVLCSTVAIEGSHLHRNVILGLILGLALWTHSQAVLLVPLAAVATAVNTNRRDLLTWLKGMLVLLGVAGMVAFWPYHRNLVLFGSLISDNPVVFRLKELNWPEYFSLARGLESWPEKFQYGLLKGWFAPEAYSLSFWFMTLGVIFYLRRQNPRSIWNMHLQGTSTSINDRVMLTALAVVMTYLCGVVISMLIRIDLMIRNERYLLMLMPSIAVLIAGAICPALTQSEVGKKVHAAKISRILVFVRFSITILLLFQLVAIGTYRWKAFFISSAHAGSLQEALLQKNPAYNAVDYLRQYVPSEAIVFSLKPADMFYSGKRMLSYLDPRLIAFYRETDTLGAWRILRELGVSHLHVPDYSLPPFYNSAVQKIIASPDLARLVFSSGGYQIYELHGKSGVPFDNPIDISPNVVHWDRVNQIVFGGRKGLFKLEIVTNRFENRNPSERDDFLPFFHRERSTLLLSGTKYSPEKSDNSNIISVSGSSEYLLDLHLEGHAFAQVFLIQYDFDGKLLEQSLVGELPVTQYHPKKQFLRRFITHSNACSVRIGIEHRGNTSIRIVKARILSPDT